MKYPLFQASCIRACYLCQYVESVQQIPRSYKLVPFIRTSLTSSCLGGVPRFCCTSRHPKALRHWYNLKPFHLTAAFRLALIDKRKRATGCWCGQIRLSLASRSSCAWDWWSSTRHATYLFARQQYEGFANEFHSALGPVCSSPAHER